MPCGIIVDPEVWVTVRVSVPLPIVAGDRRLDVSVVNWQLADLSLFEGGSMWHVGRFRSVEHAERVLREGLDIELAPCAALTFFRQLVRDGRAEVVRGRHCRLSYRTYQLQALLARVA